MFIGSYLSPWCNTSLGAKKLLVGARMIFMNLERSDVRRTTGNRSATTPGSWLNPGVPVSWEEVTKARGEAHSFEYFACVAMVILSNTSFLEADSDHVCVPGFPTGVCLQGSDIP